MVPGDIVTHAEMCQFEGQMLQRGMTFRTPPAYGVILMSLRPNAPYQDQVDDSGELVYEGHDAPRTVVNPEPKRLDQPKWTDHGKLTENGKFADWTDRSKFGEVPFAKFRVYEKLQKGIWTYRGPFELIDYDFPEVRERRVFRFRLRSIEEAGPRFTREQIDHENQLRQIPTWVKQFVYKRDGGRCVECGSANLLHYDHDLPFSKGGASAMPQNVRLLCSRHNLAKSDRIE